MTYLELLREEKFQEIYERLLSNPQGSFSFENHPSSLYHTVSAVQFYKDYEYLFLDNGEAETLLTEKSNGKKLILTKLENEHFIVLSLVSNSETIETQKIIFKEKEK